MPDSQQGCNKIFRLNLLLSIVSGQAIFAQRRLLSSCTTQAMGRYSLMVIRASVIARVNILGPDLATPYCWKNPWKRLTEPFRLFLFTSIPGRKTDFAESRQTTSICCFLSACFHNKGLYRTSRKQVHPPVEKICSCPHLLIILQYTTVSVSISIIANRPVFYSPCVISIVLFELCCIHTY